jgi:hypothetical protein
MPLPRSFRSPNLGPDSSWLIEIAASGLADVFVSGEQKRPDAKRGRLSFNKYPSANNGLFAECIADSRKTLFLL